MEKKHELVIDGDVNRPNEPIHEFRELCLDDIEKWKAFDGPDNIRWIRSASEVSDFWIRVGTEESGFTTSWIKSDADRP